MVALPDRRLVPDHDPGAVEPREQPVVQQVVRARDVRAELLEVAHDPVHVAGRQRGAVAGHVLVDGGAAQEHAAVVEVQQAALDLHRAQPDRPAHDLLDLAAVAQREARRVEPRAVGRPQRRGRDGQRQLHAPPLALLAAEAERALGHAPAGRAQAHLEHRVDHAGAAALEHAVEQQRRLAPARGAAAAHARHRAEVAQVRAAHGDEPHRAHDPAPVPPALEQPRVLAAVDLHHELVRPAGAQPAGGQRERRVAVAVAADALPVQVDAGGPAHLAERDHPAEAGGRLGAREPQPVAAHLAGIQRRLDLRVEHRRDRGAPPLEGLPRVAARRDHGRLGVLALGALLGRSRLGLGPVARDVPDLPALGQRGRARAAAAAAGHRIRSAAHASAPVRRPVTHL